MSDGMEATDFERIASALTIESICSALGPDVPADTDMDTAIGIMTEYGFEDPSPIIGQDGTVGIVWFEDIDTEVTSLGEAMERLSPNQFLPATTTILDAIELFTAGNRNYYFVLHKDDITGVLYFSDIFKPLGRLAFLALALQIEQLALRLCQISGVCERCWKSLPPRRQRKAREQYQRRFGCPAGRISGKNITPKVRRVIRSIVGCTYLVDKANMIWKCKLIPSATRSSVLGFFSTLEEIRNLCAHPSAESDLVEALPRERMGEFVRNARKMQGDLKKSFSYHLIESIKTSVI